MHDQNLDEIQMQEKLEELNTFVKQDLMEDKIDMQINENKEKMPQDLLKKYLIYARRFIKPKLSEIDKDKIMNFYADIRRESSVAGGIPIAVRHIESVIRMSESFAKMQLRDHVRIDDIDNSIEMMLDSFLQSQKLSIQKQLERKFSQYRNKKTDASQLLLHILRKAVEHKATFTKVSQGMDESEKI